MASPQAGELTLNAVLGDLRTIAGAVIEEQDGGAASYEAVQQRLGELSLHVLTYIRFLENHGFVHYDRSADRITVTQLGRTAAEDDTAWSEQARAEFLDGSSEYSSDHTEQGGGIGNLSDEVDDILDSIAEIDVDFALEEVSSSAEVTAMAVSIDERLAGGSSEPPSGPTTPAEETTRPNMSSPPDELGQSGTTNSKDSKNTGKSMSNDSFSSRRISSQSSSVASRATAAGGGGTSNLYDREETVGSGGMGTVYRARQTKLDRLVAVKEIKEIFDVFAGVQRADIVERFTEIVQTQARLLHPNIIQLVDIDTDAKFPFVVMQYAPNGNLRRLIESEGRPPLQIALKYFLQILHALNTAHDNGVTHGGIKPENVVLDHAGNALVTDFGISGVAELDANRGANQVYVGVGTVAYMSPEQFRDPNMSSVKSDIYSLGIMFYEMLTGKVPGRRSPMPSSFYPDIPRALDDVFDRMSMDDVDERYGSIAEVLTDVYASDDVMAILDKRGGFLFLRDPITHGATGGLDLAETSGGAAMEGLTSIAEDPSIAEDIDDEDRDIDEDADVLDKLDKYGELFDEDDDDSADDLDDDEADSEVDEEDSESDESESEESEESEDDDSDDDD